MRYSVQQIKFELLSYIKEFGGDAAAWRVGTTEDVEREMFEALRVDRARDIWLWKPALSATAANLVARWMTDHRLASPIEARSPGPIVFLYRRA